jgi:phosphatidylglycerol:prolipoprotein diacylglycerol transferase
MVPVTLIVGIAGAKVIGMLMPKDQMVAGEMMNHGIRIRLFGMLAAGAVGLLIYGRIVRLSFRKLLDIFAVPTLAALMIHRIGCFVAGCCWGDIASHDAVTNLATQVQTLPGISGLLNGVQYPPGSLPFEQHLALGLIEPDALASLPVLPVQLYEAAMLLVMVLVLSRFRWREYPKGTLAVLVTCSYAVLRFFVEYLRADGHIILANLTLTQLQCVLLLFSAVLLPGMLGQSRKMPIGR